MQGAINAAHAFTNANCCGLATSAADVAIDLALKVRNPLSIRSVRDPVTLNKCGKILKSGDVRRNHCIP